MMELPMHKSLTIFGLAGAATALALTPALAAAQEAAPEAAAPADASDARLAALTPEQQAAFKAWPAATQSYYWSLTEQRQKMFWALSDSDKVTLSKMPEQQRESTWAQIEARTASPKSS
jgi:hypothetical protein